MTKNPPKNKRGAASRQQIIDTAVQLFASQGFDNTGMRQLASEANVNLAMINYCFGSKKQLLREILDLFFSRYLAIATTELHSSDDLQCRLHNFISASIGFFSEYREHLIIAITDLHHDDVEINAYKATMGEQMVNIINETICQPVRATTGRQLSPKVITPLMTSMMASRFLFAPVMEQIEIDAVSLPTVDEYTDIISGVLLHGIRAGSAS